MVSTALAPKSSLQDEDKAFHHTAQKDLVAEHGQEGIPYIALRMKNLLSDP